MAFLDPLDVRALDDGKRWKLTHEFRYITLAGFSLYIPAGFITDFASIPRLVWWVCPPATGLHRKASVVHDWIYNTPGVTLTRKQADGIFLEIMKSAGVPTWKRKAMYLAVRTFGGSSYKPRA